MKKKIIKIFLILSLSVLISCGFEPLNKKINLNKFIVSEKIFSGNTKINNKIYNKLNLKEEKNAPGFILKLFSEVKIITLAKDTSGNATSYKSYILTNVAVIKNEEIIKNKKFEKSITYSNLSNKFELKNYQNQVENNLINSTVQVIKLFLGN